MEGVQQELYPFARLRLESLEDDVLEAIEEHHVVKLLLVELEKIGPEAERFDAKMTVLIENIRHHVEEEEENLFPRLQKVMAKNEGEALAAQLEMARKAAPTRPHPAAPDSPPGNLVAGPLAALLDAGKDALASLARKGRRLRTA